MAEAIVSGMINGQVSAAEEICVTDISQERLDSMKTAYGVQIATDNLVAVNDAEVVVLAVKPQALLLMSFCML